MNEWFLAKVKYTAPHNVPRLIEAADAAIAELEGENERLRRVIGAAVEDSAELEAERDLAQKTRDQAQQDVIEVAAERDALQAAFAQKNTEYVTVIGCISAWVNRLPRELGKAVHEGKKLVEPREEGESNMMAPPGEVCLGWPDVIDEERDGGEG